MVGDISIPRPGPRPLHLLAPAYRSASPLLPLSPLPFAVLKKSNGRGPGRGIEMSPTIAGDREGSLWLEVIH